jgi:hypothetical protein
LQVGSACDQKIFSAGPQLGRSGRNLVLELRWGDRGTWICAEIAEEVVPSVAGGSPDDLGRHTSILGSEWHNHVVRLAKFDAQSAPVTFHSDASAGVGRVE